MLHIYIYILADNITIILINNGLNICNQILVYIMKTKAKLVLTSLVIFVASLASQKLDGQVAGGKTIADGGDGLCCEVGYGTCDHPNGMSFDDSIWKAGIEFCP